MGVGLIFVIDKTFLDFENKIQADLNTKNEKHLIKVNSRLDAELWYDEVESAKPSVKKIKSVKNAVQHSVVPVQKHQSNVSSIPVWKTTSPGQTSTLIINSVKRNQHTLFNLGVNDFPDAKCMQKFRSVISESPKVVKAVGYQGLVFSKKYGGTLKAKVLGEFGDIRVYASQKEVSESGDTLYVFDRVDLKAH